MRTIKELVGKEEKVYIVLKDKATQLRFQSEAEKEGITFGDGAKPTDRPVDDIIENVRRRLSLVIVVIVWLYYGTVVGAFSGRIINRDLRLHVVYEYVEADAVSIILYRVSFHLHAMGKQVITLK